MIRTTATFAAATLAAFAVLSGCDTGPRPPAGVGQDPVLVAQYPNITIDGPLQKFVVCDYNLIVTQAPAADRTMFVQVPLRNQADNEIALQYNFTWYAADGRQVGQTNWMTLTLPSRRQGMATGNAIVREAVAWRLDVRSAR
jgi:uncharacterized protein YcfL